MRILERITALRGELAQWRRNGDRIALVPTMGNLHAGHLALVEKARSLADKTVVTIFVNPTQFVAGEDYATYPRTPQQDQALLVSAGADLLFGPEVSEIYPDSSLPCTEVRVPGLESVFCGKFRPGHFSGVATIVTKLLNIVQPDIALFGEKDYQQLLVIRQLVRDLCLPVKIIGMPTVREQDGLAMSSRNAYLSADERAIAPRLFQVLEETASIIRGGSRAYADLEMRAMQNLEMAGFATDYLAICDAGTLAAPGAGYLVVLGAARLGRTRLIDNVIIRR